ncbi:MAG: HEPN domain-containing protein [Candidatus Aminicenantes bacterium]|nr:MAG: HEPN domain-containing protein [Candidatus Aminicenantes bacterium]
MTKMITTIKSALEANRFHFTVSGAVLFGSRANDSHTRDSDIDLLVVAENINPKIHRRKKEMMALKRSLPGKPLDLLLLSPKEVISNFTNHNPLFLDIAEDGIIIKDKENFLSDLIKKTREYIQVKGIKRIKDGWQFPVAYRAATPLSSVSNKDFAEAMIKDGERDFSIGKNLLRDEFFDKSVYHFQQSVEKCIKSVLIAFGTFQKTHFVGEVLVEVIRDQSLPDEWKQKLTEIAELSEELEPDVSLSRYPGIINDMLWMPCDEYGQQEAEESLKKAELVLNAARDFNKYWFSEDEDQ